MRLILAVAILLAIPACSSSATPIEVVNESSIAAAIHGPFTATILAGPYGPELAVNGLIAS